MKRRTFLRTATATLGVGSIAGCLANEDAPGGDGTNTGTETDEPTDTPADGTTTGEQTTSEPTTDGSSTDEPTDTPTSTADAESIASSTLEATGDCSETGTASVAFESPDVVVTGCIQGPNGCHQPVLGDVTMDGDTLTVVVTTEEQGGDVCTQALVQRSYEATVSFEGELPATVSVVHESMGERTTVATADR
ncbi:hypothetical protein SAMN04487948_12142 [Halogranum amylolyticum]|uniref:Uncharacterized protein n=1 Tax=Halogranum amylolyticum TaxID=660520 RepID=A0A1H8VYZ9_9EURY|nr:hypothetical protein [Halogranum amylolyticum]SEP20652.1 hypothetical protein SAMN04487948_12142 [Halogranum amylolyticum]